MNKKGIRLAVTLCVFVFCLCFGETAFASGKTDGNIINCQIRVPIATKMYQTSKSKKKIKTIPRGTVLKVIKYKNHRFYVKYKKKKGWISQSHVFVNLVDYIPSIEYRLHLAQKKNLFNIKGSSIAGIQKALYTSKGVRSGKQCWLNFIAAKKLLKAQKALRKDGYSIVLYDAYRPSSVSEKLYNAVCQGSSAEELGGPVEDYIAFRSAHNKGVAVDITIKNIKTGRELEMPSKIMTLGIESADKTWYCKISEGSRNAKLLRQYMTDAGFVYLSTEWWHFQDGTGYKGTYAKEDYYNISQ